MGEYFSGVGQGSLGKKEQARVGRIARKHGVYFTTVRLPGEGWRYWFSAPNRGYPFDSRLAREVMAEVGEIKLAGPAARRMIDRGR